MKLRSREIAAKTLAYLRELRDVRVLGVHVFVVIALLVTWNGVGVIQDNYKLQKQIAGLRQETDVQNLENETQRLKNEYYNTSQYLELNARRQFSLGAPGETLLLVPQSVALANSTPEPPKPNVKQAEQSKPRKPAYQRNFEAWMEFFFRRRGHY